MKLIFFSYFFVYIFISLKVEKKKCEQDKKHSDYQREGVFVLAIWSLFCFIFGSFALFYIIFIEYLSRIRKQIYKML